MLYCFVLAKSPHSLLFSHSPAILSCSPGFYILGTGVLCSDQILTSVILWAGQMTGTSFFPGAILFFIPIHTQTHTFFLHISPISHFYLPFSLSSFLFLQSGENHKNHERLFSSTYFIPSGSGIYRKSLSVLLHHVGCNLLSIFLFSFPTLIP